MKIKACVNFYGSMTMKKDEIRDVEKTPVVSDLLKMGLITILEDEEGGDNKESE